jgi:hypothetical protein
VNKRNLTANFYCILCELNLQYGAYVIESSEQ